MLGSEYYYHLHFIDNEAELQVEELRGEQNLGHGCLSLGSILATSLYLLIQPLLTFPEVEKCSACSKQPEAKYDEEGKWKGRGERDVRRPGHVEPCGLRKDF